MSFRRVLAAGLAISASVLTCMPLSLRAEGDQSDPKDLDASIDSKSEDEVTNSDLGTGTFGRLPYHVSFSLEEGYDDNVYTTHQDRIGSYFTSGDMLFSYRFGSARTTFDLEADGGLTYYYHRPIGQAYDVNSGLTLNASHQATPRLGFTASVYLSYQSEPDLNDRLGVNRRSGNYFDTSDRFSISYQWKPRFSTVTSYTLDEISYEDSGIAASQDRIEHTFGNEFRFLAWPTTTLVGEYRFQVVDFTTAPSNSTTNLFLGGFDHNFDPHFNVSVRGGIEFRRFENFQPRTSPYGESTLSYSLGPRTSLSWTNRYGLEEPDVPESHSRTTFRTGLTWTCVLFPRLTSNMSFYYQHDANAGVVTSTFVQPAFNENSIFLAPTLQFEINRTVTLVAGFSHTEILSDIVFRDYARDRYYLGLKVTF